jgi:GNAT superfamily N-acetyltransferase
MTPDLSAVSAPERLRADHDVSGFTSGHAALDEWLRRRALANEDRGASRTYVVRDGSPRVIGYHALAVGSVSAAVATGRTRRNMPDPVPVMILARLAVDRAWSGRGLGRALVRDAVLRTVQAADIAGIRAMLVHAKSEEVRRFYERLGFVASPVDSLTLMVPLRDAFRALSDDPAP